MKPFVFVLALTCSFFFAAGQTYHPFVDTGKVWSTYHLWCKKGEYRFSEWIKFDKDTLIDGKTYKIALSSLDTNMASWTLSCFIREDAQKKVFCRFPYLDREMTIYDFGALAGDTVELRENLYGSELYIVDSINWVNMLDGRQRKRFFLTSITFAPCTEIWIEGMGCTKGVFESGTCGFTGDASLICFTENDTLLYFNPDFDQCYVITGIDNPDEQQTGVTLFPNPANELFTIKPNKIGQTKMMFELIDLSGKEIISIPVLQNETTINLKQYGVTPGFYFFHIFQGTKPIKTGKLVILR